MPKFIRKQNIVEAVQYQPNMKPLPPRVEEVWSGPDCTGHCTAYLVLPFGRFAVHPGDWIVNDTDDYPTRYSPEAFQSLYDPYDEHLEHGFTSTNEFDQIAEAYLRAQAKARHEQVCEIAQEVVRLLKTDDVRTGGQEGSLLYSLLRNGIR